MVKSGKELACQFRRLGRYRFHPWVGKILWRRTWQLTPVFSPGKFHGQRSLVGSKKSDMTEDIMVMVTKQKLKELITKLALKQMLKKIFLS